MSAEERNGEEGRPPPLPVRGGPPRASEVAGPPAPPAPPPLAGAGGAEGGRAGATGVRDSATGEREERTFQAPDDARWRVVVAGRGRSGTPPDVGAPILLLRFLPAPSGSQPDSPGPGPGDSPPVEQLAVGVGLDSFTDEALADLLTRARASRAQEARSVSK